MVKSKYDTDMNLQLTRRSFLGSAAVLAVSAAFPIQTARAASWNGFDAAIVIEGLGGPGNSATTTDAPLAPADVDALRSSGLTAINVTILPVGTVPTDTAFVQIVKGIEYWESEIDRLPDALARIRNVDDILAAKKAKRTGLIYGFQDGVAF